MKQTTYATKTSDINRKWHLFDAEGEILGRLATQIVPLLIGKNRANYSPNIDSGDSVVVINAGKFVVTGHKEEDKFYYGHTTQPGHLRKETLGSLRQRRPTEAIRHAVRRMLPKNRLRDPRMARLHIYAGGEHPFVRCFSGQKA